MSKITSEDVRKVAKLARLDLPEDLIETYTGQLEKILTYVAQLEKINTETMSRIAVVEFGNGNRERIPRANLEVILSD